MVKIVSFKRGDTLVVVQHDGLEKDESWSWEEMIVVQSYNLSVCVQLRWVQSIEMLELSAL